MKYEYVEDLGWPFTSDKYARTCPLCNIGCVFGDIKLVLTGPSAAHKECIEKWKEKNE